MTEILPEMLSAGEAAWIQSRQRDLPLNETLIEIYLAMQGMKEVIALQKEHGLH